MSSAAASALLQDCQAFIFVLLFCTVVEIVTSSTAKGLVEVMCLSLFAWVWVCLSIHVSVCVSLIFSGIMQRNVLSMFQSILFRVKINLQVQNGEESMRFEKRPRPRYQHQYFFIFIYYQCKWDLLSSEYPSKLTATFKFSEMCDMVTCFILTGIVPRSEVFIFIFLRQ